MPSEGADKESQRERMSNLEMQSAAEATLASPLVVGHRSGAASVFAVKQVPHIKALTDLGREIPLFRFESLAVAASQAVQLVTESDERKMLESGEQIFLKNTKQDAGKLVRLVEPRIECNCHGWIFAGGQFGIYGLHVPMILEDNGYVLVNDPQEGDVAIY